MDPTHTGEDPMDVDVAMAVLEKHLRTLARQHYPLNEYGCPVLPDGDFTSDLSPAPDLARRMSRRLLAAAYADGRGGCRLCRS